MVWAPPVDGTDQYLIFVGWSADPRKLGIKYCSNRPCALYAVKVPLYKSEAAESDFKWVTCFIKWLLVSQSCLHSYIFMLELYSATFNHDT